MIPHIIRSVSEPSDLSSECDENEISQYSKTSHHSRTSSACSLPEGLSVVAKSHNIQVCVRARPQLPHENGKDAGWTFAEGDVIAKTGQKWTFDYVLEPSVTNEGAYQEKISPIVTSFMEGFNGAVLAYGQSGSGKTYTLLGANEDFKDKGLLQLAVCDIFERIQQARLNNTGNFILKVHPIEVYMEKARQLLGNISEIKKHTKLSRTNATLPVVNSPEEVMQILRESLALRKQGVSNYNDHSSRSHFIFRLVLTGTGSDPKSKISNFQSELLFVDLAGSERMLTDDVAKQKKLSSNDLMTHRKEGNCINGSLLALHNVVDSLLKASKEKACFIPYNRHILTSLLENSLGGNSKTIFICNIATAEKDVDFTKNTLTFGARTRSVQNSATKNTGFNLSQEDSLLFQKLQQEMEEVKQTLIALEEENRSLRIQNSFIRARNKYLILELDENENKKGEKDNYEDEKVEEGPQSNTLPFGPISLTSDVGAIAEDEWQREIDRVFAYEVEVLSSKDALSPIYVQQETNDCDGVVESKTPVMFKSPAFESPACPKEVELDALSILDTAKLNLSQSLGEAGKTEEVFEDPLPPVVPRYPRKSLEEMWDEAEKASLKETGILECPESTPINKMIFSSTDERLEVLVSKQKLSKQRGSTSSACSSTSSSPKSEISKHSNRNTPKLELSKHANRSRSKSSTRESPLQRRPSHRSRGSASRGSFSSYGSAASITRNSISDNSLLLSQEKSFKGEIEKLKTQLKKQGHSMKQVTDREERLKADVEKMKKQLKDQKHKEEIAQKSLKEQIQNHKKLLDAQSKLNEKLTGLKKQHEKSENQAKEKETVLSNQLKAAVANAAKQQRAAEESEKTLVLQKILVQKNEQLQASLKAQLDQAQKEMKELKKIAQEKEKQLQQKLDKQAQLFEGSKTVIEQLRHKLEAAKA